MTGGTTVATYKVNALGQRVEKVASGVTTRYVYDEQGHLLGEYDGSGSLIQETVWLEDLPVATLRPTGSPGTPTPIYTYYVLPDHLGSPRAVVRPSDNAFLWRWDNTDPFGNNAANQNPAGQGTFIYALRLPGQYYDAETGTNFNYYRDYDPITGRYDQSDPIGLIGGTNTYGYVSANPAMWADEFGLAKYSPPIVMPLPPGFPPIAWYPPFSGKPSNPGIPDLPIWAQPPTGGSLGDGSGWPFDYPKPQAPSQTECRIEVPPPVTPPPRQPDCQSAYDLCMNVCRAASPGTIGGIKCWAICSIAYYACKKGGKQ